MTDRPPSEPKDPSVQDVAASPDAPPPDAPPNAGPPVPDAAAPQEALPPVPPPPAPGTAAQLPAPRRSSRPPPLPPQARPQMAPNAPPPGGPYRVPPANDAPRHTPERRTPLRTILVALVAAFAVASTVAVVIFKPPPPKQARSIGARLDLAAGEVTVRDGSSSSLAISGTPLAKGAVVETGRGARALVRTGEGAAVFMRGETSVTLGDRVEIARGEVWIDAPGTSGAPLEYAAGAVSVSASDAGLDVRREGDDVTVYVARGLAVVTAPGGRVEIGAGEQAIAKRDGKPEVSPVAFWNDWTGGMGDQRGTRFVGSGTGRLYGLDPSASAGAPARKLGIAKQVVRAVVRDGIAETEVDQTFSNPGGQPIEGWYWFSVPPSATVTGFALETDGQLVEGEVIERREAAARYEAAVRQANDPALLEWVDGRTYRARIFPIPASGSRRVVLRYVEMLPSVEGKTRYVYPLRSDDPVRFDEFALSVDVGGTEGEVDVATSLDARFERGGRLVSMRRSGYVPRADFQLEIASKKIRPAVAAWRFQAGADQADYVMLRYVPEKDFASKSVASADVVLVVDTSAGGDESSRQLRVAAAEAALRALSDQDHFALVALDVAPVVVYPTEGLAPATESDIAKALEKLSDHAVGGATDLGAMFEPSLARLHGKEQAAVVYVGDGAPTSGETGAEPLVERLRRSLTGSRARFFTMATGADAQHELLAQLARAGGGQFVRVDEPGQTTNQALRLASAIKTPTITDLAIDLGAGLDQPLYSATGKLSRGEELVLLARTHHPLPKKLAVRGRLDGKPFEDQLDLDVDTRSVTASLVPRLWAAEYARRLMGAGAEENRGQILQLGVEYGLVTPFTSSLALESEAAYARQGIPRRRSRVRGVRLTAIERPEDEERLMRGLVPSAPPVMMGCSKRSPFAGDEEAATETADVPRQKAAQSPVPAEPPVTAGEMANDPAGGAAVAATGPTLDTTTAPATAAPSALGGLEDKAAEAPPPPAVLAAPARRPAPVAPKPASRGGRAAEPDVAPLLADALARDQKQAAKRAAVAWATPLARALSRCSDVASRPLAERIVLWHKRASRAQSAHDLARLYDQAYAACELPDWRDEAALLDAVQRRIATEQAAETVLAHFAGYPAAQRFLARNLLRRTVDVRISAAVSRVLYGAVDWDKIDRDLADTAALDKQLARVKAAMLVAPGDPRGDVRLVRLLARAGQRQEALAHGRRLRDRGFLTPTLAAELGDVLAEAGETEEAVRTYSEIVEFDGASAESRRVLGDIYLRQGWYPAAYRQYKTLTDLDPKNPLAWLRLANAAAGAGRIDEALRIDRDVLSGEGSPGPSDPRVFARLLSGARLGALLEKPDPAAGVTKEAISRKLKELTLFSGPGTLALLTWEDLDAQLVLGAADEKKEDLSGEATDAGAVGLFAVLSSPGAWERAPHAVRFKSDLLRRPVRFTLVVLTWDGRSFEVTTKKGALAPGSKQEAI